MVGVSAMRGTDPEDIVVVSQGGGGFYTVQVTGYNGATSPKPVHAARRDRAAARRRRTSPRRTVTGTVGPALPTLPTGLNTVFLVNRQQLQGVYGSTRRVERDDRARERQRRVHEASASRTSSSPSTASRRCRRAYATWNAAPGQSRGRERRRQGDQRRASTRRSASQPNGAGLKYLVIVGGDQVIPFARLDDFTVTASNEAGYASTFGTNTDLFATLNAGQMLSDDPYGDVEPGAVPEPAALHPGARGRPPRRDAGGHRRHAQPLRQPGRAGPPRPDDRRSRPATTSSSTARRASTRRSERASARRTRRPCSTILHQTTPGRCRNLIGAFLPPTGAARRRSRRSTATRRTTSSSRRTRDTATRSPLFTTERAAPARPRRSRTGSSSAWAATPGLSVADAIVTAGATARSTGRRPTRRRAPAPTSATRATATATASSSRTRRS